MGAELGLERAVEWGGERSRGRGGQVLLGARPGRGGRSPGLEVGVTRKAGGW